MAQHLAVSNRYLGLTDFQALLPWIPAGPVLDAGCGSGNLTAVIAKHGLPVTALDINSETIQVAQRSHPDKIEWLTTDIREYLLPPQHFAAIFCLNVFPFIPNEERPELLKRLKAAVKPGGLMVLAGFTPQDPAAQETQFARCWPSQAPAATGILAPGELSRSLKNWEIWHDFEGRVLDHHPPTGAHVHGMAQIVARKPMVPLSFPIDWTAMPHFGAGLGWRRPLLTLLKQPDAADFLEIQLDDFLDPEYDSYLAHLLQQMPVLPHGVELSIGSKACLDSTYLQDVARVVARCGSPWWSDHLCYTRTDSHTTYSLNTLPATAEAIEQVARNAVEVAKHVPVPLLLENVAYYVRPNQAEMSDAEFLVQATAAANCGILLDVANLYGNACNLGIDPYAFIDTLPGERVLQVHLAGGRMYRDLLLDTHDASIWPETWKLLQYALKHCDIRAISLERDGAFEQPEDLLYEVSQARQLMGLRL